MATVDSLASEMFKRNAELQQLRAHVDQQAAIQAETSSQQTTKTMSLDDELRSLYANAEAAIRQINTDFKQRKDEKTRLEKRREGSLAKEQRYDTECHDEKRKMGKVERKC